VFGGGEEVNEVEQLVIVELETLADALNLRELQTLGAEESGEDEKTRSAERIRDPDARRMLDGVRIDEAPIILALHLALEVLVVQLFPREFGEREIVTAAHELRWV
jgi:hypothetical protein